MKIQVRKGVFETNSSSTHCIAIMKSNVVSEQAKKEYYDGWRIRKKESCWKPEYWDEEVDLWTDDLEFGWGFDILNTFEKKVMYAIASLGENRFEEIQDIVKEVTGQHLNVPVTQKKTFYIDNGQKGPKDVKPKCFIRKSNIYWDEDKFEYYRYDSEGNKVYDIGCMYEDIENYGSVDHQSIGKLQWFLDKHKIPLKDFLTDECAIIIIDNDNVATYEKMFDSGMLSKKNFVVTGLQRDTEHY